jgi:hypothetical protein
VKATIQFEFCQFTTSLSPRWRGSIARQTETKERYMPSADKAFAVDSTKLERGEVWGETDSAVHWKGAFAVYGGHGATASSVIV